MILLPILQKNNESIEEALAKLKEEHKELIESATDYRVWGKDYDRDHMVSEVLDCIEVLIGMLEKLKTEGADIERIGRKHVLKLANRHQFVFEGFYQLKRLD